MSQQEYTVGAVARLAGLSVRTLHHYDRIGLLCPGGGGPGGRSPAGYRRYSLPDLKRLQQILCYRELGFPLTEITRILAGPGEEADAHLRRQHRLLRQQISRRQQMLAAIEKEMEARQMGISLTPEEQFEVFGTDQVSGEWAQEAEQRWGGTAAWRESQRRTAACTKEEWLEVQAEATAISQDFLAAMRAGEPADGERAMAAAERHRQHIVTRFCDCGYQMHTGLAGLYLEDQRFARYYDDTAPGLARYVHDAIVANAARHTS